MKQLKRLEGMIAATFTPMNQNGEINLSAIDKYADMIAKTSIKGVFVCGTTGEFASMSVEERKAVLERWIKAARKRFLVIAHVGSNNVRAASELARHASEVGADAIASIAPSFFKPGNVHELIEFFKPICASAPELPFYYYNMPSITGVNLPVDKFLIEGAKELPNLVGIKFTHNNLMEMGACINLQDRKFEILHGYDEILVSGLAMGAVAGVGSTYNYLPNVYQAIFDAMKEGDLTEAQNNQLKSIRTVEVIIKHGGGVRGGKAIMKLIGIDCGDCRLPFTPFSDTEYNELQKELEDIGFFGF